MPTYEFVCPNGHHFDKFYRKMSDAVSELPCPECSEASVRQILVNLLSNAVKFTERGEVGVAAARDGNRVTFEVWDTGIGIPAKFLDRIYDPFWQAEQRMTRRYGGAGVGLAVAHRLSALLGGEISVSSTVGAGSRFLVSLPARPAG